MMKIVIASTVLILILAWSLAAGPPIPGDYNPIGGRYTESYAGGGQGQMGNVVHAMSWDGSALGTRWYIACPVLAQPPELLYDSLDATGTGYVGYRTDYTGGYFWLAGTGPWGNGDASYTGTLDYYYHITDFLFVGGSFITYTTNAYFGGTFDDYCLCITGIANGAYVGSGAQPADYPPFLEGNCSENPGLTGEWGSVRDVLLSIYDCSSGNELTTWGSIKSLYR